MVNLGCLREKERTNVILRKLRELGKNGNIGHCFDTTY
jgi:hypothetical protein